jgi:aminoglycoside/choline kinase family phosphotransferase
MSSPQVGDPRMAALVRWLLGLEPSRAMRPETLRPASSDASFRRYFRIDTASDGGTLIIMDAPPEFEDVRAFVAVAELLARARICVPVVLAHDSEQGFVLLSDLGSTTYLNCLTAENADGLYRDACGALIRIQTLPPAGQLPDYDRSQLNRELQLFPDWYLGRHRGYALSDLERGVLATAFGALCDRALAQPRVIVHRDYHSRNLMLQEGAAATNNPGILDFQDAVVGPITYDLVSLLRDAYIAWDEERILDWAVRYWEGARRAGLPVASDFGEFWRDFEWMGLQRHLKVLGIFARLHYRDGKDNYLKDLPLVLHYTRSVAARYREFFPLLRILDSVETGPMRLGLTF